MPIDFVVIGGGAAGMFAAINAKLLAKEASVVLLEKSATLLAKVRISGGGRCNVTHQCFDPKLLVNNYPRGSKELLSSFYRFQPKDTVEWFAKRGVKLKAESDGRMFPITDSSQTIIDCLMDTANEAGVNIQLRQKIEGIEKKEELFYIRLKNGQTLQTKHLLLATGSGKDGYEFAKSFKHTIDPLIPSLFTFNIPSFALKEFSGVSVNASVRLKGTKFEKTGPILITHFGFSGPAVIKLSAFAAKYLHETAYHAEVIINWTNLSSMDEVAKTLLSYKNSHAKEKIGNIDLFSLPKKLKRYFVHKFMHKACSDLSNKDLYKLAEKLFSDVYQMSGKTTNKEEFVTCGGISLKEVHFQNMESKLCSNLYFAGEILNIDGITGGFNFQSAWTTGYLAASDVANKSKAS